MNAPIDRVTEDDVRVWEAEFAKAVELAAKFEHGHAGGFVPGVTPIERADADVQRNKSHGARIVHGPDMLGRVLIHVRLGLTVSRIFYRHGYMRGQHGCFAVFVGDVP